MEEEKDIFEDLIRKKLSEHESAVPDHLWTQISSSLPAPAATGGGFAVGGAKLWVAAAAIVGISITTYFVAQQKDDIQTSQTIAGSSSGQNNNPATTPTPEVKPTENPEEEIRTITTYQTVVSPPEIAPGPVDEKESSADWVIETKGPSEESTVESTNQQAPNSGNISPQQPSETTSVPAANTAFTVVPGNESGMLYFFIPQGDPEGTVEWDFGDGNTSDHPSPAHEYSEAGTYVVQHRVRDEKGQVLNSHSVEVRASAAPQLILPTIFTPNGDGHNDQFDVLGASKGFDEIVRISVKTRDGRVVYEGNAPLWNGEDQSGAPLQTDNYVVEVIARSSEGKIVSKNAIVWLQRN